MSVRFLALVTASAVGLSACAASNAVIDVGQRIHHDDFEYSVQHVERRDRIGDRPAIGFFYIVAFQVENHALRVEHRWANDIAYLVDREGRQYENDGKAQQTLDGITPFGFKDRHVTPAGAIETTMLVFDLPRDAREPYLKVRGWFLMGDLFDLNQYQRTRVKLF